MMSNRRVLTKKKCKELLEKHYGSVAAIAHELGISRQAVYQYLDRHPELAQLQKELRDALENEVPACAKANIARAILREAISDEYPHASFQYLKQRDGISVTGSIAIIWDWGDDAEVEDE